MISRYKYAKRLFPDENSPYTVDTLPMHKDSYFFVYGIDIDSPIEMANQIIYLKEQLEASERARKEAIEYIKSNANIYLNIYGDKIGFLKENDGKTPIKLLEILDIDKGE